MTAERFNFWGSPEMIVVYVLITLALVCFGAAVRGKRLPFVRTKLREGASVEGGAQGRKGIVNLEGGQSRTKGSHFGPGLDTHIENVGERSGSEDEGSTFG